MGSGLGDKKKERKKRLVKGKETIKYLKQLYNENPDWDEAQYEMII